MKNIFTTAVIATAALFAFDAASALSAKAEEHRRGTIAGYRAEVLDSSPYDYLEVYGPNGREDIVVSCSNFNWESSGPNPASWVNYIAKSWCF